MTTTYTFQNLIDDVKKEAQALRVHATAEELDRLDFSNLSPVSPSRCIYGQIAKGCFSNRAAELISACTPKYFDRIYEAFDNGIEGVGRMSIVLEDPNFKRERSSAGGLYARYSAIEAYILLPEAKNANLIAFLRGETDTLDL